MTRQLGKALGIIAMHGVREEIMHADVDAFYAPSECHALIARGEEKRLREAKRHARAVSGLSRSAFNRELRKKSTQRALAICFGRILHRDSPFH